MVLPFRLKTSRYLNSLISVVKIPDFNQSRFDFFKFRFAVIDNRAISIIGLESNFGTEVLPTRVQSGILIHLIRFQFHVLNP